MFNTASLLIWQESLKNRFERPIVTIILLLEQNIYSTLWFLRGNVLQPWFWKTWKSILMTLEPRLKKCSNKWLTPNEKMFNRSTLHLISFYAVYKALFLPLDNRRKQTTQMHISTRDNLPFQVKNHKPLKASEIKEIIVRHLPLISFQSI